MFTACDRLLISLLLYMNRGWVGYESEAQGRETELQHVIQKRTNESGKYESTHTSLFAFDF